MKLTRRAVRWAAALSVASTLLAFPALAYDPAPGDTPILSDRWVVDGQYSFTSFQSSFKVGSGKIVGAWIRLEDDIGVDDSKDIWQLSGLWRWGSRSSLVFNYAQFSRGGSKRVDEEVQIGDFVYGLGAKIKASIDWQQLNLSYRWSAVNTGTTEAGFAAGLSTIWVEGTFEGRASVVEAARNKQGEIRRRAVGSDILAPVPVFGGFIIHAFTPRLAFSAHADLLALGAGDYKGSIIDARATLRYFVTRNFGLGLNIFGASLALERSGERPLDVELGETGAGLVVTGSF